MYNRKQNCFKYKVRHCKALKSHSALSCVSLAWMRSTVLDGSHEGLQFLEPQIQQSINPSPNSPLNLKNVVMTINKSSESVKYIIRQC